MAFEDHFTPLSHYRPMSTALVILLGGGGEKSGNKWALLL